MFDIKKNEEEIVIQMLQDSPVVPSETAGLQRHLIGFIVIKVRYTYIQFLYHNMITYTSCGLLQQLETDVLPT
jgi:hypothetical protein